MNGPGSNQEQYDALWERAKQTGMSRRTFLILLATSGTAAVLSACQSAVTSSPTSIPSKATVAVSSQVTQAPTAATAATTSGTPTGNLRIAVGTSAPQTFDPITANRVQNMYVQAPMFDFLVRTDDTGKNVGVAENVEMAKDGLSWTFQLHKGVKFHDGSDLTAKDVKYSLERYATEKGNYYSEMSTMQDRVEIVDDYTVKVYTKGVQPYYSLFVSFNPGQQGMIMPMDYIQKNGVAAFAQHPVGSGPFKFVRYVPGDRIEYEAVASHFRQTPAFKNLSLMFVPEEATRVAMLKTGEVDIVDIGLDSVADVEKAGLKTANLAGSQIFIPFYGTYDARAKALPTADVRVRNALNLAIDRNELNKTFFAGKLQPPMPPGQALDQPELDAAQWKEQAGKIYRFDLEEAKRLLKEAGFADGFSLKFYSYNPGSGPYLPRLAQVIQGYWQKIGVKAELAPVDWSAFSPWRSSGPNKGPDDKIVGQCSLHVTSGNPIPTRALSAMFWSQGTFALTGKPNGVAGLDDLITNAQAEPDAAKRKDMIAKIMQMTMDAHVWEVVGTVPVMVGVGALVDGEHLPRMFMEGIGAFADGFKRK